MRLLSVGYLFLVSSTLIPGALPHQQVKDGRLIELEQRAETDFKANDLVFELWGYKYERSEHQLEQNMTISVSPLDLVALRFNEGPERDRAMAQIKGNISVYLEHMCAFIVDPPFRSPIDSTASEKVRSRRAIATAILGVAGLISAGLAGLALLRNMMGIDKMEQALALDDQRIQLIDQRQQDYMEKTRELMQLLMEELKAEKEERAVRESIDGAQQAIREVLKNPLWWLAHQFSTYKMLNISLGQNELERFLPVLIAMGKTQVRRCDVPNLAIHVTVFLPKHVSNAQPIYEIAHKGELINGTFYRWRNLPRYVSAHFDEDGQMQWEQVDLPRCEKPGHAFLCPWSAVSKDNEVCGMANLSACEIDEHRVGIGIFVISTPFHSNYLIYTNAKQIRYFTNEDHRLVKVDRIAGNFFPLDIPPGLYASIGEDTFKSRNYVMPTVPLNHSKSVGTSSPFYDHLDALLTHRSHPLAGQRSFDSSSSTFFLALFCALAGLLFLGIFGPRIWKRCKKTNVRSLVPFTINFNGNAANQHQQKEEQQRAAIAPPPQVVFVPAPPQPSYAPLPVSVPMPTASGPPDYSADDVNPYRMQHSARYPLLPTIREESVPVKASAPSEAMFDR